MKRIVSMLLVFLLLCIGGASAEEVPPMESAPESQTGLCEGYVTRDSRKVTFFYPEECEMVDDGDLGTFITTEDDGYVVIILLREGITTINDFCDRNPNCEIIILSDTLQTVGHPQYLSVGDCRDLLEVGVVLPDGSDLIVMSICPSGQTEIYDLLMTVIDSMTDAELLEKWLQEE